LAQLRRAKKLFTMQVQLLEKDSERVFAKTDPQAVSSPISVRKRKGWDERQEIESG
jgi:hypothetical protein